MGIEQASHVCPGIDRASHVCPGITCMSGHWQGITRMPGHWQGISSFQLALCGIPDWCIAGSYKHNAIWCMLVIYEQSHMMIYGSRSYNIRGYRWEYANPMTYLHVMHDHVFNHGFNYAYVDLWKYLDIFVWAGDCTHVCVHLTNTLLFIPCCIVPINIE